MKKELIDFNEKEMRAMNLFKQGKILKAQKLQSEFIEEVTATVGDFCSCTADCKYHGKCYECITLHRGHGDHVPECLRPMINKKIKELSSITENTLCED